MNAPIAFPLCQRCGVRVGVYEPARIELADGTIVTGSLLGIGGERRPQVVRVWHRTCLDREAHEGES